VSRYRSAATQVVEADPAREAGDGGGGVATIGPRVGGWQEARTCLLALAGSTAGAVVLRAHVAATNLAMLYVIGVVLAAMRLKWQASVALSLASVAAFDFFCVPPYYTFRVDDYQYVITFAAMLLAALAVSTQTARVRTHAAEANAREARTLALYRLSGRLVGQTRILEAARLAAEYIEEVCGGRVAIFMPEDCRIDFSRRTCDQLPVPPAEVKAAQSAFDRCAPAGLGCEIMSDATALYLPLRGAGDAVAVMAFVPDGRRQIAPEQTLLLEALAHQTAMVIDRMRSQHAAESARLAMEAEQMRSSLLSAVSHDLRTPLASITGAASTLRDQGEKFGPETRHDLLDSIAEEAERLGRLVSNLLDMTRLESGVGLRREFYPLEEIVGAVLQRLERRLGRRQIITSLPDNLPLAYVDDVLFGQLLINLLENAAKYTPEHAPVELAAESDAESLTVEVAIEDRELPPASRNVFSRSSIGDRRKQPPAPDWAWRSAAPSFRRTRVQSKP
jgi:two-component system sensor histidine kinase KdpD